MCLMFWRVLVMFVVGIDCVCRMFLGSMLVIVVVLVSFSVLVRN